MQGLRTIQKQSVSDAVFEQLRDRILFGGIVAGERLPSERSLCEALGVNRSAVREALKRLEQARLVSVRHGGSSRVLDFRGTAGLDLLPDLLFNETGNFDPIVVRSVIEMRSALAPDAARLAAARAGRSVADRLDRIVVEMQEPDRSLTELQDAAAEFWTELVTASGNVAYQLAYNSMSQVYDQTRSLLAEPLAEELRAVFSYAAIAGAVRSHDEKRAESVARDLIRKGEAGIVEAFALFDSPESG